MSDSSCSSLLSVFSSCWAILLILETEHRSNYQWKQGHMNSPRAHHPVSVLETKIRTSRNTFTCSDNKDRTFEHEYIRFQCFSFLYAHQDTKRNEATFQTHEEERLTLQRWASPWLCTRPWSPEPPSARRLWHWSGKNDWKLLFFKILTEHQRLELTDCSHARGGQVGVFMLQFAIQSDAPPLPVVGQQRQHLVDFLQRRSRRHRVPDEKEQISFKGNTQNNQKVKISAKFNVTFFTKFWEVLLIYFKRSEL